MNQEQTQYQKFSQKIQEISSRLSYLLQKSNSAVLNRAQKYILHEIMGLIKYVHLNKDNSIKLQRQLLNCLTILSASAQQVPKLKAFSDKILKQFKILNNLICQEQRGSQIRHLKNYAQASLQMTKMENKQKANLNNIQDFINMVANGQLLISDHQCIGCTQVLIKNMEITSEVTNLQTMITLNEPNTVQIVKYSNALLNLGGGVIIIGAKTVQGKLVIKGNIYKNEKQLKETEQQIADSLQMITPKFEYNIRFIQVKQDYMEQSQQSILCLTITLIPTQDKIFYITIDQIENRKTKYESYYLSNNKILFNMFNEMDDTKSFYKMIHSKRSNSSFKHHHQNILCCKPLDKQHKFNQGLSHGVYIKDQMRQYRQLSQHKEYQQQLYDQPKIKYKNVNLLIVSSWKNQKYVASFQQLLGRKKIQYDKVKPFQHSFFYNGRSIWMFSHYTHQQKFKALLNSLNLKPGALILMNVAKNLEIEANKLTHQKQQFIKKQFRLRYRNQYKIFTYKTLSDSSKYLVQKKCLAFDREVQAIYAYVIMEKLQLKPYFTKQIILA